MKVKQLEDYYGGASGDAAWHEHVDLARESWVGSPLQTTLLRKVKGDLELASVIYAKVGDRSLEWLEMKVPALHGRKPISCLDSRNLVLRLREALMRMD
jgi:hypothetical protein